MFFVLITVDAMYLPLALNQCPGLATLHRHRARDGVEGPPPEKGCVGDSRAGGQRATREGPAARRETKGQRAESREDDGVCDSLGGGGVVVGRLESREAESKRSDTDGASQAPDGIAAG